MPDGEDAVVTELVTTTTTRNAEDPLHLQLQVSMSIIETVFA